MNTKQHNQATRRACLSDALQYLAEGHTTDAAEMIRFVLTSMELDAEREAKRQADEAAAG